MKQTTMVILACALAIGAVAAQQKEKQQPQQESTGGMLKQFARSMDVDGIMMSFVYLNDRTVEVLFQPPGKYSLRALAKTATLLYVQGTPDKDGKLDTTFYLEQDGQTTEGVAHNIKHFQDGAVTKGERIDGLLQFDRKLDLTRQFTIKSRRNSVKFKLSEEALKLMAQ
jgi:DNA polymerase III alpha subunit